MPYLQSWDCASRLLWPDSDTLCLCLLPQDNAASLAASFACGSFPGSAQPAPPVLLGQVCVNGIVFGLPYSSQAPWLASSAAAAASPPVMAQGVTSPCAFNSVASAGATLTGFGILGQGSVQASFGAAAHNSTGSFSGNAGGFRAFGQGVSSGVASQILPGPPPRPSPWGMGQALPGPPLKPSSWGVGQALPGPPPRPPSGSLGQALPGPPPNPPAWAIGQTLPGPPPRPPAGSLGQALPGPPPNPPAWAIGQTLPGPPPRLPIWGTAQARQGTSLPATVPRGGVFSRLGD